MTTGDFDQYYSDNPWEAIDKNQRTWYDPDLVALFRQRYLFTPTIQFTKNLGDLRATKMVLNWPDTFYLTLILRIALSEAILSEVTPGW